MMSIDECNGIVKETIYNNMTNNNKSLKNIDEFGFYQYTIFTEGSGISKCLYLSTLYIYLNF